MGARVIAYVDKTVVKIQGVKVNGLKPIELEKALTDYLKRPVRVIGVTGESIEMDIYGIEPELIFMDENGIVKAISNVEGIHAAELIRIDTAEKVKGIPLEKIPKGEYPGCAKERWALPDE